MKTNVLIFSLFLLALAGCSPAVPAPDSNNEILIDQATVRLPGGDTAEINAGSSLAGYLRIQNTGPGDESLMAVQADFSGTSMLHQSSVDGNGVANMGMILSIRIPAGQTVELKPGGFHVIFEDLKKKVKVGDTVMLVLNFEKAGTLRVQALVTSQ